MERRQGTEDGGGIQDVATRRRRKESWCWYHRECDDQKGCGMSGEMAGEDHCNMDDDPPTDGMCPLGQWIPNR